MNKKNSVTIPRSSSASTLHLFRSSKFKDKRKLSRQKEKAKLRQEY